MVGETSLSAEEVQAMMHSLGQTYKGCRYHLLQRNCNHFASDLCYQLCGRRAPTWVSRGVFRSSTPSLLRVAMLHVACCTRRAPHP